MVSEEQAVAVKVLVLCEYPPSPAGLATQADLFCRGLRYLGVEVRAVHLESAQEKEWCYRWFQPDVVVGVGYWGYTPQIILHPQRRGLQPVPWLVADGFIADYLDVLNDLPLLLVTSNWVKQVYVRDGVRSDIIEVLPVGCDTDAFAPHERTNPRMAAVRASLGVDPDQLLILTVGGDAASKGAREVMEALARIDGEVPDWRYVCKVWPQARTDEQNRKDLALARSLGIADRVIYSTCRASREFMPYLIGACDIYAGPSRLEGFGMPQVEAGACGKPVLGIRAMAMLDTLVHNETALLAGVERENVISETIIDEGLPSAHRVVFDPPRVADYRASVDDLAAHLLRLMRDPGLRTCLGRSARIRVVEQFDYRVVARRFIDIISRRLGRAARAEPRDLPASVAAPTSRAA